VRIELEGFDPRRIDEPHYAAAVLDTQGQVIAKRVEAMPV
jgi:hypothetical protein